MITSVNDWLVFLKESQALVGIPLVICGAGLMIFGWRLWKVCVILSFGLIGAGVTAAVVGPGSYQALWAIGGGALLGLLSYWPVNYSIAILGGLIGAAILGQAFSGMGLDGPALWIAFGLSLLGCAALAFLNRRHVVIVVTAFLGAACVISGLTAFVMEAPSLYGTLRTLARTNAFVVPFVLLVPTLVSCFYQEAEVQRTQADV